MLIRPHAEIFAYLRAFAPVCTVGIFLKTLLALLLLISLNGCQSLPSVPHLAKSQAISAQVQALHAPKAHQTNQPEPKPKAPAPSISPLHTFSLQAAAHPNQSGYYPIATGADAFSARSTLIHLANASIDVQYYIWHHDEMGQLVLQDLWAAAERGVKVRLLLDDFNSDARLDTLLLAFATHPNIAVRLANPAAHRKLRALNFITNPLRINRRMHNKSMTFDNHISILGGRNIGNEYLHANENRQFADSDVLLIGKVVTDIYHSFNDYWNAPFSYDIETLVDKNSHPFQAQDYPLTDFYAQADGAHNHPIYRRAVLDTDIGTRLAEFRLAFRFTPIYLIVDHPSKLMQGGKLYRDNDGAGLMATQLRAHFGRPKSRFSAVSSYFAPTKDGVNDLIALADAGVKVSLLTNSYGATDVTSVHAGYGHWRKALLQAGVKLYESKPNAPRAHGKEQILAPEYKTPLHAKLFAVDESCVYIGSYNIDPRSANLNSEIGVVIYDTALAKHLHDSFNDHLLNHAYELRLEQGALTWHTLEAGQYRIYRREPNMHLGNHISNGVLSLLPIDGLL